MTATLTLDALTSEALRNEAAQHKKSPTVFLREMLEDLADYRLVERRTKEIGIRKVLGASVIDIVSMVSKQFLSPVAVAIIIAIPASIYFMNNWLQQYAYRISISWWIFAASAGMVILVALITISIQSIKAALANPVKSLRTE